MGLHFSKEEFSSRKSKVLKSMKEQNIDALLMFDFDSESQEWFLTLVVVRTAFADHFICEFAAKQLSDGFLLTYCFY